MFRFVKGDYILGKTEIGTIRERRPAQTELYGSDCAKEIQRLVHAHLESAQRSKDILPSVGLSLIEAYLEGRLTLIALYKTKVVAGDAPFFVAWANKLHIVETNPQTGDVKIVGRNDRGGWDKNFVFVRDVEFVKGEQIVPVSSLERLDYINQAVDDFISNTISGDFLSLKRAGHVRLRPPVEGEVGGTPCDMPVSLGHYAVRVVEGGPEIVDSIAKHRGSMTRQGGKASLPLTTISLGAKSIAVPSDILAENELELVDVMFGPFGL